jgi:signal transduction histidine kinase
MRRVLLPMAVLGIAVGMAAEWGRLDGSRPNELVPDLVTGWVLIACGVAVLTRVPGNRCGWVLTACGIAWFVPNFEAVLPGIADAVAAASLYLHRGFFVHLLLAYPNGTTTRAGRWMIFAGYGAAVTPTLWGQGRSAIALSAALVAASAVQYRLSIGIDRSARRAAFVAATAFAVLVASIAVVRMSRQVVLSDGATLRVYDATLIVIALGLTAGLLLSWWRPDLLTDLVVELRQRGAADVRARLAQALGDPDLRVGYWLPESAAFIDFEGRTLPIGAEGSERRTTTLLPSADAPVAAVIHGTAVLDQPGVLEALTAAGRLAAANAQLRAEVRARVDETVQSRRRLVKAGDEERERLGRRLRDGAERHLQAVADELHRAGESAGTAAMLDGIRRGDEQLARAHDELVRLARGLHPRALVGDGLAAALAGVTEFYPLRVELDVGCDTSPETSATACAYFVCTEALANTAKHASASAVRVSVDQRDGCLRITVSDDGVGGADDRQGSGLRGLADRVEALGGTFTVTSPPGGGTIVEATILGSASALRRDTE